LYICATFVRRIDCVPYVLGSKPFGVSHSRRILAFCQLAITVFDTYETILEACCKAWNRFANQPAIVTSINNRCWAAVTSSSRWYK
jgi:hypothetical protein